MLFFKMGHILISIIMVLLSFGTALTQSIVQQNIKWNTTKTVDRLANNEVLVHSTSFISSSSFIKWSQGNGLLQYTFTVISKEGDWPDVSQAGKSVYHVKRAGLTGTIGFEKKDDGKITIELIMQEDEDVKWSFYFEVESLTMI